MTHPPSGGGLCRRAVIEAAATLATAQLAAPFVVAARGEQPVRFGYIDPLTGAYADVARSEITGARHAVEEVNAAGGVLGRRLELLVEDSANDVGTGVQKARKLLDRDRVSVLFADVNSAIAYAVAQVATERRILDIVPGGHTDPITGSDCKWNVFRICNTTRMDANAIAGLLMEKFGRKWYFLTPDYAYGHTLQAAFVAQLTRHGGTYDAALTPIGTTDYSSFLIKARAYAPGVLIDIMGGNDQVNSLKQYAQFGLQQQMPVSGTLFELESLRAVPDVARVGWWTMEWWWNQPGVAAVQRFDAAMRRLTGRAATARNWFGYAAVRVAALAANQAGSLDGVKMAHVLEGYVLPPEIALQANQIAFRAGDHELMSSIFVGEAHPPKSGDPDDMFTVAKIVPGIDVDGPLAETGCNLAFPA